jgi:hypothetical protein
MNPRPLKTRRRTPLAAIACSLLSTLLPACAPTRVVTVPTTTPRQLAENVQAYVYVETTDGKRIKSANRTQLFEGEWVLSDPGGK